MALSKKAQQFLDGYKIKAQVGTQLPELNLGPNLTPYNWQTGNGQSMNMQNPYVETSPTVYGTVDDIALDNTFTNSAGVSSQTNQQQAQPLNTALGMLGPAGKLAMGAHQLIKSAKERKEAKLMDKMFREDNKRRMENARGEGYYMTPYTVGRTTDYTMKDGGQIKNNFRPTKRNTWRQAVEGLGFDREYLQSGGWLDSAQQYLNEGMNTATNFFKDVKQEGNKIYDSTSTIERDPMDPYGWQKLGKQVYDSSGKIMNYFPETKQAVVNKGSAILRPFMQMGGQPNPVDQFMEMYYNQQNSQNQLNQSIADTYTQQSQALNNKWKQNRTQGFQNLASGTMDGVKMAMGMMQDGGPVQEPVKDTESIYSPDFEVPWEGEEFNNEMQEWFMEDDGNQGDPEIAAMYDQVMSMPIMENPEMDNMVAPTNYSGGYSGGTSGGSASTYKGDTPYESIIEKIGYNESRGRYDEVNEKTQTVGKYQFMEHWWADKIRSFMGLPANLSKREVMTRFKDNPEAQEKYMRHVIKTEYEPQLPKMRQLAKRYGFNDEQLIRLMHYRGVGNAYERLQSGDFKVKQEEKDKYNNPDVLEYLNK